MTTELVIGTVERRHVEGLETRRYGEEPAVNFSVVVLKVTPQF